MGSAYSSGAVALVDSAGRAALLCSRVLLELVVDACAEQHAVAVH